jgi:hypothetical protein
MATQHVVAAPEIGRTVDYPDGRGLLHHTHESGIPPGITADSAGLLFREIAAVSAGPHPFGHRRECGGEASDLFGRLL